MDVSSLQGTQEIVHIHNYSMYAVKSLICEIKKFPIIYKDSKGISLARELNDLAWCRIISAVLDCEGEFSSAERTYWDLSFRELWKWMRLMLVRDMKARAQNRHIRNPKYGWLDYLKFVEKYICLEEETAKLEQSNPNIHVQLITANTDMTEASKHTVVWVRDSRESTSNENEGISICLRSTANTRREFTIQQQTSPISLLSFERNNLKVHNSPTVQPVSASILSSACFPAGSPPSVTPIVSEDDLIVPQQRSCELVIDEDFQFIMSLLPKLKNLEPKVNANVKMLIMQALHDAF